MAPAPRRELTIWCICANAQEVRNAVDSDQAGAGSIGAD
jgi:hypothetical protein